VIFDKFRQGGDMPSAKASGSGLGLHISRQIVEHYGGRMWVESGADSGVDGASGGGACFSFTLPVDAAAASRAA
jgi:signal transduction histidine kinase